MHLSTFIREASICSRWWLTQRLTIYQSAENEKTKIFCPKWDPISHPLLSRQSISAKTKQNENLEYICKLGHSCTHIVRFSKNREKILKPQNNSDVKHSQSKTSNSRNTSTFYTPLHLTELAVLYFSVPFFILHTLQKCMD